MQWQSEAMKPLTAKMSDTKRYNLQFRHICGVRGVLIESNAKLSREESLLHDGPVTAAGSNGETVQTIHIINHH